MDLFTFVGVLLNLWPMDLWTDLVRISVTNTICGPKETISYQNRSPFQDPNKSKRDQIRQPWESEGSKMFWNKVIFGTEHRNGTQNDRKKTFHYLCTLRLWRSGGPAGRLSVYREGTTVTGFMWMDSEISLENDHVIEWSGPQRRNPDKQNYGDPCVTPSNPT